VPSLHEHTEAPFAPDADADDVNLAADLDLDLTILVVAGKPSFLLGMRVAKEPSHDLPPVNEKYMGRGLAGAGSSSEAPLKEDGVHDHQEPRADGTKPQGIPL
jgi:hypothetical protein